MSTHKDWGVGKTRLTETPVIYDRTTGRDVATVFGTSSELWLMWSSPLLLNIVENLLSTDALNNPEISAHDIEVRKEARDLVKAYQVTKEKENQK